MKERWGRLRLYAITDSQFLRECFTKMMKEYWLYLLKVQETNLNEYQRSDLDFINAGIVSYIANGKSDNYFDDLQLFLQRDLGRGIIETINDIRKKGNGFS